MNQTQEQTNGYKVEERILINESLREIKLCYYKVEGSGS
jgi:hypothetical protein